MMLNILSYVLVTYIYFSMNCLLICLAIWGIVNRKLIYFQEHFIYQKYQPSVMQVIIPFPHLSMSFENVWFSLCVSLYFSNLSPTKHVYVFSVKVISFFLLLLLICEIMNVYPTPRQQRNALRFSSSICVFIFHTQICYSFTIYSSLSKE